jgi:sucrose-6-phosphate hydrolase SacC (GH32 family)
VLTLGPGKYDEKQIALNQVVRHGGHYYAYYHGSALDTRPSRWTTNVAVSDDLLHWEKYMGNPLFPVEANKSSGILVHDGEKYRLYTMHDRVDVHFPKR